MSTKSNPIVSEPEVNLVELREDSRVALRVIDDATRDFDPTDVACLNKVAALMQLIETMLPNIQRAAELIDELEQDRPRVH